MKPDTLIRNPCGKPVVSSVTVACDAARAWAVVGDFAGFDRFIPALSHIEMTGAGTGSLRKKCFHDGNLVVEQLNSRDEQAMHDLDNDLQHFGGGTAVGSHECRTAGSGLFTGDLDDHRRAG